ncbi:hypothetical protein KCU88_g7472, partial [Aureobasidium melanogenum]
MAALPKPDECAWCKKPKARVKHFKRATNSKDFICESCGLRDKGNKGPPSMPCEKCGTLADRLSPTPEGKLCRGCTKEITKDTCETCGRSDRDKFYWTEEFGRICRVCNMAPRQNLRNRRERQNRRCVTCDTTKPPKDAEKGKNWKWWHTTKGWMCPRCGWFFTKNGKERPKTAPGERLQKGAYSETGVCNNCGRPAFPTSRKITDEGYLCYCCVCYEFVTKQKRPPEPGIIEFKGICRSFFGPGRQTHQSVIDRRVRNRDRLHRLVREGFNFKHIRYQFSDSEPDDDGDEVYPGLASDAGSYITDMQSELGKQESESEEDWTSEDADTAQPAPEE